ncbi:MAG: TlpA family protein disulfide reductase [Candidatus Eremiobacteraeota bacterium]|nr:TlpA family protein disulfide reductase [Candidatus Eremiobacteraeota bacterium]MBV8460740.1 TlpA family protein disulfide reductase [Candidatus Eremiobacteraeota bacterium]MBV8594759.1 TlpA family protein disulfide reductase [Candidatus Eremiobacteraeota bacterium]MBV8671755.1 TlpA family protein disulfide reductase [Candidatus Eremiobacteraeota bacterium]
MIRWLIGGLVVVAVIVLIAALYPNANAPDRGPAQAVGARLPALTLPQLHGSRVDLDTLRGDDVLVNVWATWCGPCRREMPALARLSHAMQPHLVVVAIDQGEDPQVVGAFVKQFGVNFPIYLDPEQRVGTTLHLVGLPSSFFVDRSGTIRDAVDGEMTYDTMREKAQRLVAGG